MRPRKKFPPETTAEMKLLLAKAASLPEYSRIQAVLIRALAPELQASKIAAITGLSTCYVAKLHSQFLRHGAAMFAGSPGRGGHRHGAMTEKGRARKEQLVKRAARRALLDEYISKGMPRLFALMKIEMEEHLGRAVSDTQVRQGLKDAGYTTVTPPDFANKSKTP